VQTTGYFSYSFAEQKSNPYKVYAIDPGLYNAVSFRFSENIGRLLENVVYLALRSKRNEIFLKRHFTVGFSSLILSRTCVEHGYWLPS